MIQLNLLPDVKIAYIKARGQKRLVILSSTVVTIVALAVFVLLFSYVHFVQSKNSNDLSRDIKNSSSELASTKDLNKILTVQNQLTSLNGLHDQKPAVDRLQSYIAKTTSQNVKLSQVDVDFTAKTVTVTGKAISLDAVNAYADTLKTTTYTTKDVKTDVKAFSNVVLTSFSRGDASDDGLTTSFTMNFVYDAAIFDSQQDVNLKIAATGVADNTNAFGEEQ